MQPTLLAQSINQNTVSKSIRIDPNFLHSTFNLNPSSKFTDLQYPLKKVLKVTTEAFKPLLSISSNTIWTSLIRLSRHNLFIKILKLYTLGGNRYSKISI
ncbi:hypothetical protein V6Z12_A11G243800 [Gossypium hirsutum]